MPLLWVEFQELSIQPVARFNRSEWIVAEADEFDRSFLHLKPELAVITSMDADHLDIYGSHEKVIESFQLFAAQIKEVGRWSLKRTSGRI